MLPEGWSRGCFGTGSSSHSPLAFAPPSHGPLDVPGQVGGFNEDSVVFSLCRAQPGLSSAAPNCHAGAFSL